jgi:pyruvate/2-oxoglutarate dehydrogenase complex dihydrolipoamide dehydrogenase (E3) component
LADVENVDTLILGSGQGGKLLAWHLARGGQRVAVVERRWVGGSCPAVACLPSKNEIWSAEVAHIVASSSKFGTTAENVHVDVGAIYARKQAMVDREAAFHVKAYEESGAELIMGRGVFVGLKTIEVELNSGGTRILKGDQIVINVGSHAMIPDVPGLAPSMPLTHVEALELKRAPEHLLIVGGGYVGLEMAQAFRRFGSRVTVVEKGPRLLSREDSDVSDEMLRILTGEGVEVLLSTDIINVEGLSGESVTAKISTANAQRVIKASDILVAAGRIPNTAGIGLEMTGVHLDARGFVAVTPRLEASAPGIWAIGECAGSPLFTHVSVDDFRIVRDNMGGGHRRTDDRLIPHVVFTDPPLARVGMDESEAGRREIPVRVAKLPMRSVLRTQATDQATGFMKVLIAADSDQIVGFSMIGAQAGEVMAAMQTAMLAKLPYPHLRDAVIAHLTYAEGLGPLLSNVPPPAAGWPH